VKWIDQVLELALERMPTPIQADAGQAIPAIGAAPVEPKEQVAAVKH
jgi:hypothetical protein